METNMNTENRRKFLQQAMAVALVPTVSLSAAHSAEGKSSSQKYLVSVRGDLRGAGVALKDLRPGILSQSFELPGNGTYKVSLTPRKMNAAFRQWTACAKCGSESGSAVRLLLTDESGKALAKTNMVIHGSRAMGTHIFAAYGVMVTVLEG